MKAAFSMRMQDYNTPFSSRLLHIQSNWDGYDCYISIEKHDWKRLDLKPERNISRITGQELDFLLLERPRIKICLGYSKNLHKQNGLS